MRKITIVPEIAALHSSVYLKPLEDAIAWACSKCANGHKAIWEKIAACAKEGWLLTANVHDALKAINRIGEIADPVLGKNIRLVFNYAEFAGARHPEVSGGSSRIRWVKNARNWGKNEFIRSLGIKVCPYCNASEIGIVESKGKHISLVDCDHYFSQEKYPYLALALANLVPCCMACNERIKLRGVPPYPNCIHPYEHDFHDEARFEVLPRNVSAVAGGDWQGTDQESDFCVEIECKSRTGKVKVDNFVGLMSLKDRYAQIHGAHVRRIISKRHQYESDSYRQYLNDALSGGWYRLALESDFGFDLSPDKINQVPFGKLTIDVMDEIMSHCS